MELKDLKTKFLGQDFRFFKSIDSTQFYAKELDIENNAKNGTVVFSDVQTAGIGTHSRKWYTGNGKNLAFTLVLYPDCKIKNFERFTYMLAETMLETIQILYNINLQIKNAKNLSAGSYTSLSEKDRSLRISLYADSYNDHRYCKNNDKYNSTNNIKFQK